ncbi:MAG: cysteine desulfurase-like protein [Chloroflexia bacterium]|nr:cysteine desulfurase-like protein [Chloroflexia bacterium]
MAAHPAAQEALQLTATLSLAETARRQFPSLTRPSSPIYFDNPGGTQVPQQVPDAMMAYLLHDNANVHGAFPSSAQTDNVVHKAHAAVADFLGAAHAEEIAFGPNMTTLTFALSRALGRELREGDEILLTQLDHDANIAPWLLLAEDRGLTVRWAEIDPTDCTLDVESFRAGLNERTRVAAFAYASNAVGTVNDVGLLTRLAHKVGALVFIDAVQFAPHDTIDVQQIGCDFLACSPYKYFGPHAGVLYARLDHSERLRSYKVRPASDAPPYKWETGTQSHEAMAGTTAAIEYLASIAPTEHPQSRRASIVSGMTAIHAYELSLSRHLIEGLAELPVRVYGITDPDLLSWRLPTFAITTERRTPRQLAEIMGRKGYNLWDGNYYALALMERLGLEGSGGALRIGLVHYNTHREIDGFLADLGSALSRGSQRPARAIDAEESAEYTAQG